MRIKAKRRKRRKIRRFKRREKEQEDSLGGECEIKNSPVKKPKMRRR
jgi:hypothetical protein